MRDPVYRLIGSIIKQRRKELDNMKQETLAGKLAISRGSLANIETGRQSILVHQLYKFAQALELSPKDLLPPPTESSSLDGWTGKLPSGLKPQQRQQIARMLEDAHPEVTAHRKQRNANPSKH